MAWSLVTATTSGGIKVPSLHATCKMENKMDFSLQSRIDWTIDIHVMDFNRRGINGFTELDHDDEQKYSLSFYAGEMGGCRRPAGCE